MGKRNGRRGGHRGGKRFEKMLERDLSPGFHQIKGRVPGCGKQEFQQVRAEASNPAFSHPAR